MKLRAVLQDPLYIREFHNIIATLSKLTKDYCVIKFSADHIHLIANQEYGTPSPLVWVDITAHVYFPEYIFESADIQHPCIVLIFSALDLLRAMSGSMSISARTCKIKLNYIQFPCLSIESQGVSDNPENIRITNYNVPVEVVPICDWSVYDLPSVPLCKIVLNVPSIRVLRALIDKMNNLSPNIIFYGTSTGELSLVAETEMATITTRFRRLILRSLNQQPEDRCKSQLEASCSVDCRKAFIFFSALQLPTEELSCGIEDESTIHLQIDVREGVVISSILPAVSI